MSSTTSPDFDSMLEVFHNYLAGLEEPGDVRMLGGSVDVKALNIRTAPLSLISTLSTCTPKSLPYLLKNLDRKSVV